MQILHLSAYEDGTEFSETSAYKLQAPGIAQKKAYNYYNVVGPPSYMRSVVDRNVVKGRMPVTP